MVESVAELDEELLNKYLEGEELTIEELKEVSDWLPLQTKLYP